MLDPQQSEKSNGHAPAFEPETAASPHGPAAIFNQPRRSFLARYGTPLLVVTSVAMGAVLEHYASAIRWFTPAASPRSPSEPARIKGPVTLRGPGGPVTLPMSTPVVLHVWLQGCQDCMPAFDAIKRINDAGGLSLPVPVVNVAYGSASASWANDHGVGERLVDDPSGAGVVRPLGISTFTTVVLDEEGYVRMTDRPDNPGYADRIQGAARALVSARSQATP